MAAPPYNYPTTPTAFGVGAANSGIYTAYQFVRDNPQYRRQLMGRHGMTKKFFAILQELNLGTPLKGPVLGHWEKDWSKNNFEVGSIVTASTGPGTNVVVALANTSMYTTDVEGYGEIPYSYPSEKDKIKLYDGNSATIISKDETVNPHQLTIRPDLKSVDLSTGLTAGNKYFIYTNASAEGTRSVQAKMPRYFKWENVCQIVKTKYSETGTSLTNELPFRTIEGREGAFIVEGTAEAEALQMDRLSGMVLFGQQSDNITEHSDATGHEMPVRSTQGMDDFVVNEGGTVLQYTAGAITMDVFDAMGEIFNREKIKQRTILMPLAYNPQVELNNLLKDYMDNTCFDYAVAQAFPGLTNFMVNPEDGINSAQNFFLWLDFKGVRKNGFNFLFKYQEELDEVMGAGTPGYNWGQVGYALPAGMFKNRNSDPLLPTIGYQYKALNGYSREWEMYTHGGAGPVTKTTDLDAYNLEFRSELGGHFGLANQMIKLVPTP